MKSRYLDLSLELRAYISRMSLARFLAQVGAVRFLPEFYHSKDESNVLLDVVVNPSAGIPLHRSIDISVLATQEGMLMPSSLPFAA